MKASSLMMVVLTGASLFSTTACHSVRAAEKETITVVNVDNDNYSVTIDGVKQEVITRDMTPSQGFTSISMGGATNITINKGKFKVVVTGAKKIVEKVNLVSDGQTLSMKKDYPVAISITMPELKGVSASGATMINVTNNVVTPDFKIDASGAANMQFQNIQCDGVDIMMSGGARLSANGMTVKKSNIQVAGGAAVYLKTVSATTFNCGVAGGALIDVNSVNAVNLIVECSGGSHVKYEKAMADDVKIGCSGASIFKCPNVQTRDLSAQTSGSGCITVTGISGSAVLQASGAARINAKGLKCKDIKHETSGVSSIEL